jgi:hypothetical protein
VPQFKSQSDPLRQGSRHHCARHKGRCFGVGVPGRALAHLNAPAVPEAVRFFSGAAPPIRDSETAATAREVGFGDNHPYGNYAQTSTPLSFAPSMTRSQSPGFGVRARPWVGSPRPPCSPPRKALPTKVVGGAGTLGVRRPQSFLCACGFRLWLQPVIRSVPPQAPRCRRIRPPPIPFYRHYLSLSSEAKSEQNPMLRRISLLA